MVDGPSVVVVVDNVSSAASEKRLQLRRDRNWNVVGKNRRKSLCIGPKFQLQLRQMRRERMKNQRIERYLNGRKMEADNSRSSDGYNSSFNEIGIATTTIQGAEVARIPEVFKLMLASKQSDHPYDRSPNQLAITAATTVRISTNETSNSFQSSRTMYSTFGLRKLPKINKVVTPMRQQNYTSVQRQIGIVDICSWSQLSIDLKALVFAICMLCASNLLYNVCV